MLLARAVPSLTYREAQWEVSLAEANALIHASRMLAGERLIWPDPRLSKKGRWWQRVKEMLQGRKRKA